MKLSILKEHLQTLETLVFYKKDGTIVPAHFHITEVGQVEKRFIDCGGTLRNEQYISMQLWEGIDKWHRLEPSKLLHIISLAEKALELGDHEVEVEYQGETIGRFGLLFQNGKFFLQPTTTQCLASDLCIVPSLKVIKEKAASCCTPGGGCC